MRKKISPWKNLAYQLTKFLLLPKNKHFSYTVIEFFVSSRSYLSFTKPVSGHSILDSQKFSELSSLQAKVSFFFGIYARNASPQLANFWAFAADSPVKYSAPFSHATAKSYIGMCINKIWEKEWTDTLFWGRHSLFLSQSSFVSGHIIATNSRFRNSSSHWPIRP